MNKGQRRALLLLLIGSPGSRGKPGEPVFGITRLQKLLFILNKEYELERLLEGSYKFEPFRYGPYSRELYDDLEFLENLGLISAKTVGNQTYQEQEEDDYLDIQIYRTPGEKEEQEDDLGKVFRITDEGLDKYKGLQDRMEEQGIDVEEILKALTEVKSAFGEMPLTKLIRYVYHKYPKYAERSELTHLKAR